MGVGSAGAVEDGDPDCGSDQGEDRDGAAGTSACRRLSGRVGAEDSRWRTVWVGQNRSTQGAQGSTRENPGHLFLCLFWRFVFSDFRFTSLQSFVGAGSIRGGLAAGRRARTLLGIRF